MVGKIFSLSPLFEFFFPSLSSSPSSPSLLSLLFFLSLFFHHGGVLLFFLFHLPIHHLLGPIPATPSLPSIRFPSAPPSSFFFPFPFHLFSSLQKFAFFFFPFFSFLRLNTTHRSQKWMSLLLSRSSRPRPTPVRCVHSFESIITIIPMTIPLTSTLFSQHQDCSRGHRCSQENLQDPRGVPLPPPDRSLSRA